MSPKYSAVECRAAARHPCRTSSCRLLTVDGGIEPAEVREISGTGVGLLCQAVLRPGEVLAVELAGPGARIRFALEARVVHAQARPDGRWVAGCAFAWALPPALLALLQ